MRPEIDAYLQKNGSRYTTKALRAQLIHAGYDAAEVDAALQETEATRAPQFAETRAAQRSRFWWAAIALNVAGLLVATIWAFQGPNATYAGAVPIVLGICLLISLGISGLIGSSLLGRGLAVALLVPLIFTLALTGVCMAMFAVLTGAA
jgi:uncharacterized membrane protein